MCYKSTWWWWWWWWRGRRRRRRRRHDEDDDDGGGGDDDDMLLSAKGRMLFCSRAISLMKGTYVLIRCVSTWTGEWVTGCDLVFRPSMTHPHLQQVHHQLTTPLTWMTQHRALVRRRSPSYSITLMMTFHTDLMSITANSMRLKAILQDGNV